MAKKSTKFLETVKFSKTEEDVKNAYAKFFVFRLKEHHDQLKDKLLVRIKEYGIIE